MSLKYAIISAVSCSTRQYRRATSGIWFTTKGATNTRDILGVGMDKKCRNMERKSSYASSGGSTFPRSDHRRGFSASVGCIANFPLMHNFFSHIYTSLSILYTLVSFGFWDLNGWIEIWWKENQSFESPIF